MLAICKPHRMTRSTGLLLVALACLCTAATAQRVQVALDPSNTKIDIAVHDIHGGFHGSFLLKSGSVIFDPHTGNASGEIVVDATSGRTGNDRRDRKMHKEILESQRYPEITFMPKHVKGSVALNGTSNVEVEGLFHIHGADHDLTLSMPVQVTGDKLTATINFIVPYEEWGMKNPSVFLLRVSGKAEAAVSTAGRITVLKTATTAEQ